MNCPFCQPEDGRVFYEDSLIRCLWDGFPVSDGHALIIPKRHFANWFAASTGEQVSLLEGIDIARKEVERSFNPDGFNIGINVDEAAGQTIPHVHVHLIPRYRGDMTDPRGGVRYVIPDKGNYLAPSDYVQDAAPESPTIFGVERYPLLAALSADIAQASAIDLAVAFVTESGLNEIEPFLVDLFERHGSMRMLTGDYLGVTEPRALRRLLDLAQEYETKALVRIFQTDKHLGFHPKAYILHRNNAVATAYIGSSNLTKHALLKGLEWNQRIDGKVHEPGLAQISAEFERLFNHAKTTHLNSQWIEEYEKRRTREFPRTSGQGIDIDHETPPEVPTPHPIQAEALAALKESREAGNHAGLVVMATGLGKTWLAAFDSVNFERVLFVAHREEILNQALSTFRKIRPDADLGVYMGGQYEHKADVLFASIQTLSRQNHLNRFAAERFDYIVVDEFHHAAASTYRRLIDHFDPRFLLGLTATPERTDGGDLLGLCGENLVFRCDLMDGIRKTLLSPFHYYGVPDEVDFANIPWRSGRFDLEKLEHAVATETRAQNAYDQWTKRGQTRTLAFCVSKLHADFMAQFFLNKGVEAVAVHSGPGSAPRTQSLKQLEDGELKVVFAVDMFNEGVDVPTIDTVMMLRPTESKILWLQQFGRGLRRSKNKSHLSVIDYIGNHRTFLQVPMLLLPGAGTRPGEVSRALKRLQDGDLELPEGCSVEYELEALNILKQLAKPSGVANQIIDWYRSFRELHGRRPTASEAYHEGYTPGGVKKGFGSWQGFVKSEGDLSPVEEKAFVAHRAFLEALEITPMTKSFKMLTLLGMMAKNKFPGNIGNEELAQQVARFAKRIKQLKDEFGDALDNPSSMRKLLETNPIKAWVGGQGMGGTKYFKYEAGQFSTAFEVETDHADALCELTRELCDWRLAQYLDRHHGEANFAKIIPCKVSHSGGNPILFLPHRDTHPGIPTGWTRVVVDGDDYKAKFGKVAVNVLHKGESEENHLPELLRAFFGDNAGLPGTSQQAKFVLEDGIYHLHPIGKLSDGPELWKEYMRADIPPLWGLEFNPGSWNQGYVYQPGHIFLLVSLNKRGLPDAHQFEDRFISRELFQWVSQNQTRKSTPTGQRIANHRRDGTRVHLFVRERRKTPNGRAAPFFYCGDVNFVSWKGNKPITVEWQLEELVPGSLTERFNLKNSE